MTIKVQTPDHGVLSFDADDWTTEDPEDSGELWVGDRNTQVGVAQFARGAWLFVYEVKDGDLGIKWSSIKDIPPGVAVLDKDGDEWTPRQIADVQSRPRPEIQDMWGPFTLAPEGDDD